jgi:hypothetical protein
MSTEHINLYRTCKRYVEQQVELTEVIRSKMKAVQLEYFEEAAAFYSSEQELEKKNTELKLLLERYLTDGWVAYIDPTILIPFKRSLLDMKKGRVDILREHHFFQAEAWILQENMQYPKKARPYVYSSVEQWYDLFLERKNWLQVEMGRPGLDPSTKKKFIQEIKEIERDFNGGSRH